MLSILSTQPYLLLVSIFVQKYTLDMFPQTHIKGFSRVDRITLVLLSFVISMLSAVYILDIRTTVSTCFEMSL